MIHLHKYELVNAAQAASTLNGTSLDKTHLLYKCSKCDDVYSKTVSGRFVYEDVVKKVSDGD